MATETALKKDDNTAPVTTPLRGSTPLNVLKQQCDEAKQAADSLRQRFPNKAALNELFAKPRRQKSLA